jgi:hypothetical protein
MMIPLSSIFRPTKKSSQKILIGYAIGLVVVGVSAILLQFTTSNAGIFPLIYFFGIVAYQFVANALLTR